MPRTGSLLVRFGISPRFSRFELESRARLVREGSSSESHWKLVREHLEQVVDANVKSADHLRSAHNGLLVLESKLFTCQGLKRTCPL